jgi:hypothetical protein
VRRIRGRVKRRMEERCREERRGEERKLTSDQPPCHRHRHSLDLDRVRRGRRRRIRSVLVVRELVLVDVRNADGGWSVVI